MSDEFEKALNRYRQQLRREGDQALRESLASGRIALPHKVRAANFALREWEQAEHFRMNAYVRMLAGNIFNESFLDKLEIHLSKHWKWWIGTLIAFFTMLATFQDSPDPKIIASNLDTKEIAQNIDTKELAKIIAESSDLLSNSDLKEMVEPQVISLPKKPSGVPIPFKKPPLNAEEETAETEGMTKIMAGCLILAANTYSVPPAVLVGIYMVEGGKVRGEVGPFSDGSYLLGPMKISSNWISTIAEKWDVRDGKAYNWVKNDPCTNMGVSAWILRGHMNETGSLAEAIALYGAGSLDEGGQYKRDVVNAMRSKGLLKEVP